jgi:hypothetical protein
MHENTHAHGSKFISYMMPLLVPYAAGISTPVESDESRVPQCDVIFTDLCWVVAVDPGSDNQSQTLQRIDVVGCYRTKDNASEYTN